MMKTVPFQTIQFTIYTQFSSIWPIERTLTGAATPGQSGARNDGNEGLLRIPHSSSINGSSPSDILASYQDIRWWKSYPSAEKPTGQKNEMTQNNINIIIDFEYISLCSL